MKTESFIVYKAFEVASESIPQFFLQVVVLAKIWEEWYISTNVDNSLDGGQCGGNQLSFVMSLLLSGVQVAVTLQDLMERDIPYGVFPSKISIGMRQPGIAKWGWQIVSCIYFATGLFLRLFSWLPFCVLFGLRVGFIIPYASFACIRIILIYLLLAERNLATLSQLSRTRNENSKFSNIFKDTEGDVVKRRKTNIDDMIDLRHLNAIFAETLPWIIVSVFIDLPLAL